MPSIKQIQEAIREEYLCQHDTLSSEDDTFWQALPQPKIGNCFYVPQLPKRPYLRKKNTQTV